MSRKIERRVGFMCGVDFEFELGEADGGNVIYPSMENLKKYHKSLSEDGIVEVEVKVVRWLKEPTVYQRGKR